MGLERLFYERELVMSEKGSSRGKVTTQFVGAGGYEEGDQRREVGTLPESCAEHLDLEQGINSTIVLGLEREIADCVGL